METVADSAVRGFFLRLVLSVLGVKILSLQVKSVPAVCRVVWQGVFQALQGVFLRPFGEDYLHPVAKDCRLGIRILDTPCCQQGQTPNNEDKGCCPGSCPVLG